MLSIALCTYNGARFLREQLDSLVQQSLQADEIVVCDDCSTDSTLEILREYACRLPLEITVNSKNLGYAQNFSQAVALCRGDYIALCDQDDIWEPDKLEKLLSAVQQEAGNSRFKIQNSKLAPPLLLYSDRSIIDERGQKTAVSFAKKSGLHYCEHDFLKKLFFNNPAAGCTMLFNRALLQAAGCVPLAAKSHDWWYILIAAAAGQILYVDEPLVRYRLHGSNQEGLGTSLSVANIRKQLSWQHNREYLSYKVWQAQILQSRLKMIGCINVIVSEFCAVFRSTRYKRIAGLICGNYLPQGFLRSVVLLISLLMPGGMVSDKFLRK